MCFIYFHLGNGRGMKSDGFCQRCGDLGVLVSSEKKNLRSHCFFPKLLSSSTNKLKRSFQTTSPMQIITKPSFDMDLIAHCEKDFPSDP